MCAKTIYEYSDEMNQWQIDPGSIDEVLHFHEIFKNNSPVEIEIGFGKGRFILAESNRRPETNFLGIERARKFFRIALLRLSKNPRPNCRLLCMNADLVVKLLIPDNSVSAYHVYFPDPWPKDRHHKRRLFNQRFLEKMADTLKPGGMLYLKTDHQDYYHDAQERIANSLRFEPLEHGMSTESLEDFNEADEDASHFEIRWRMENRTIFMANYSVIKPS